MTLTDAQKQALQTIDANVVLHGKMKNGHAYDHRGKTKLIDRRTLVVLDNEELIDWERDWGYNDYKLTLSDRGEELLNK